MEIPMETPRFKKRWIVIIVLGLLFAKGCIDSLNETPQQAARQYKEMKKQERARDKQHASDEEFLEYMTGGGR